MKYTTCEICNVKRFTNLFEGLCVCFACQEELGILKKIRCYNNSVKSGSVHMNGSMACNPRPYGQLPGNTGFISIKLLSGIVTVTLLLSFVISGLL